MKKISFAVVVGGICLVWTMPAAATKRPDDSGKVGTACVDKYEASVWSTTDAKLIKSIQKGKIDAVADLAGATQHGIAFGDYGAGCPATAAGCLDYYAVSMPGVLP